MAVRTENNKVSSIARIGYVIWQAGLLSTFVYPIESGIAKWQYFNIFIELAIICVAAMGVLLIRQAHSARLKFDKTLIVGQFLTSAGMVLVASGLAFSDSNGGTALAWLTLGIGPVLLVIGIIVSSLQRAYNPDKRDA